MSKARDLADFISTGSILSDGTIESTEISGVTADATEINKLDGLTADTTELNKLDGVTATTAELNKLAGTTATTSDFDKLSNVTASATELNYMTGATSSIQSQLDNISVTSGSLTKSFTNGESATITLAQSITPAPVVSVTKEVSQAGQSSKGAWDVNATASNYDLHNTAYATTLTPSSVAVSDVSQATFANKASSNLGFGLPRGLWFKPDGSVLFVLDNTNAQLLAYALSTAWDASTASYSADYTFTVGISNASSGVRPYNFWFNSTGTSLYVNHLTGVYEHTLSTAWDVTTISYVTGSNFYTGNIDGHQRGLWWKPDGTRMYTCGLNYNTVYQWDFSTAFDFSTGNQNASSGSFAVNSQATSPRDVQLNSTGTKMFVTDDNTDNVYEYDLSTAWDITTATYNNKSFSFTSQDTAPQSIHFGNNNLYMVGDSSTKVHQYNFSSDGLVLGTGSFASTDVGKRIQGNGGDVILTSTAGAYNTTGGSDFTDSSTIASGSWTMHGLKSAGDADGLTISGKASSGNYTLLDTTDGHTHKVTLGSTNSGGDQGFTIDPNGLYLFAVDSINDRVKRYDFGTPWDLSTLNLTAVSGQVSTSSYDGGPVDIAFNPSGTKLYVAGQDSDYVYQWNLSTAWDLGTGVYAGSLNVQGSVRVNGGFNGLFVTPDGTKLYTLCRNTDYLARWNFDSSQNVANASFDSAHWVGGVNSYPFDIAWNPDGSAMYLAGNNNGFYKWNAITAFEISSGFANDSSFSVTVNTNAVEGFFIKPDETKIYTMYNNEISQWDIGEFVQPNNQYHLAVTNASGQIDSSFWTDINSMTADQSLGDGEAYYAVSTDDRTTWSVAKGSDGVRPIVRNNSGTWQYNTAVTTVSGSVASASYDSVSAQFTINQNAYEIHWRDSGNLLFVQDSAGNQVVKYTASTPYDVTTLTQSQTYSFSGQEIYETSFYISPDGLHFYIAGSQNPGVHEYSLSTAYDLTTVSYDGKFLLAGSTAGTISFKPDGTRIYVGYYNTNAINTWPLTTAWDTSSYGTMQSLTPTEITRSTAIQFNADGTKMFVMDTSVDKIFRFNLSTAYDITTATKDEEFLYSAQTTQAQGFAFNNDFTKMNISGSISGSYSTIYQYSSTQSSYTTSTTWTNATTNDEFYALQQALGYNTFNRMDKTQLDAVADGSHFTLGNTLDLMIALKQDTASASLPTSDGVTINYDAEALNQGAVLGTDYDFDFPANNKVRITSNAAQNLKIRVV